MESRLSLVVAIACLIVAGGKLFPVCRHILHERKEAFTRLVSRGSLSVVRTDLKGSLLLLSLLSQLQVLLRRQQGSCDRKEDCAGVALSDSKYASTLR